MLKNLLNPGTYAREINIALLFLRITIGIFMLTHGISKFMLLLGNDQSIADPIGIGESASLALAVFAEMFCSILLILEQQRVLRIAYYNAGCRINFRNSADPFRVKEMALIYLSVFISILIAGAGNISVDNLIYKKIDL
jgi:putative oxidoreductase